MGTMLGNGVIYCVYVVYIMEWSYRAHLQSVDKKRKSDEILLIKMNYRAQLESVATCIERLPVSLFTCL